MSTPLAREIQLPVSLVRERGLFGPFDNCLHCYSKFHIGPNYLTLIKFLK